MFVAFSKVFTPENLLYFAKGAVVSLLLAAVSLLFGIVFGILGSSAKRSKYKIFRIIGNVYVEVIRGTPMLLQILILFSVIPSIYTAFTGNVLRINVFLIGAVAMFMGIVRAVPIPLWWRRCFSGSRFWRMMWYITGKRLGIKPVTSRLRMN